MAKKPGVYPVYENQFQVGADSSSLSDIADMDLFQFHLIMVLKNGLQ